jgi:hypothetical protein
MDGVILGTSLVVPPFDVAVGAKEGTSLVVPPPAVELLGTILGASLAATAGVYGDG